MSYLYQDIDLESVQFVNNKNDIAFTFQKSLNGKTVFNKKLILENIHHFEMDFHVDKEYSVFPYYLIALSIDEIIKSDKHSKSMNERISKAHIDADKCFYLHTVGELEINLICESYNEISL